MPLKEDRPTVLGVSSISNRQKPKRFRWLGRWHRILKCSVHEENRRRQERFKGYEDIYRCETYQGMIVDLYSERGTGTWVLERVWD